MAVKHLWEDADDFEIEVLWDGIPESTWEPIRNLIEDQELITIAFLVKEAKRKGPNQNIAKAALEYGKMLAKALRENTLPCVYVRNESQTFKDFINNRELFLNLFS